MARASPVHVYKPVPKGKELGGKQQISAGAGASERSGPCCLKGRMSASWGGICITNQCCSQWNLSLPMGKDALFSQGEDVLIAAPLQQPSHPAPLPGPAPSCLLAAAPRSTFTLTSASSLGPPLHRPFTTSFNVLLPPWGSCAGPCLDPLPGTEQPMLLGLYLFQG